MLANVPNLIALWAIAYILGAIPCTYLLARTAGRIDLRNRGSGNLGASNLASQLGKRWFPLVALIDFARGAAPVLLGHYVLGPEPPIWGLAATPLFGVLGNNWSPFLRFRGGRGVGVWAGGVLALSPLLFVAGVLVYVAGWLATRRSPEWLLLVMIALPAVCLLWPPQWFLAGSPTLTAAYVAAGAALILLKRILANGEAMPAGASTRTVLLNRLLRDRDIADRALWLARLPETADVPNGNRPTPDRL